ncbi:hypothetical protein MRX96_050318 [Rhipicephalus microplus]
MHITVNTTAESGSFMVLSTEAVVATKYDTFLQFMDAVFTEKMNVLGMRHFFTSRKLPGGMYLRFITAPKEKALSCKLGAIYGDRIRDLMIDGDAHAHVRVKLLFYGESLGLQEEEKMTRDSEALRSLCSV